MADIEAVNKKLYGTVMETNILSSTPKKGRDEKRAAIVKIAYEAFLTDGYAATSMSSIAAKVGGSKATLYNYFASKEELFAAVIEEECRDVTALLIDDALEGPDFRMVLTRLGEHFLRLLLSDDKIATYRLITAETARFPELGRVFYQTGPAQGKKQLAGFFAKAVLQGKLRPGDTQVMAFHFFDLCSGDLHRRRLWNVITDVTESEIKECISEAVRIFLAAYGPTKTIADA